MAELAGPSIESQKAGPVKILSPGEGTQVRAGVKTKLIPPRLTGIRRRAEEAEAAVLNFPAEEFKDRAERAKAVAPKGGGHFRQLRDGELSRR